MYSTWALHKCAFLLPARSDATAHEVVSLLTGLSILVEHSVDARIALRGEHWEKGGQWVVELAGWRGGGPWRGFGPNAALSVLNRT